MKFAILQINGGIGKVVASTAICRAIKKTHPDRNLIVLSGYPDVFLNNPNVYRAYGFGQASYFYSEFVEDKDTIVFAHDPYLDNEFVKGDKHLNQVWCEMFDLKYDGQTPEIYLTEREVQFNLSKYQSDKPIFLMQTNGGANNQAIKYSWARDIPSSLVLKVIEEFKPQYNIVHIRREDQIGYNDAFPVTDNFRSLVTLISMSKKRLLMDSFAQHTASALGLSSVVLWIANTPVQFGYDIHTNIVANPFTTSSELKNSYLQKFDISGDPVQFPYRSEEEIFNVDEVIEALKKD